MVDNPEEAQKLELKRMDAHEPKLDYAAINEQQESLHTDRQREDRVNPTLRLEMFNAQNKLIGNLRELALTPSQEKALAVMTILNQLLRFRGSSTPETYKLIDSTMTDGITTQVAYAGKERVERRSSLLMSGPIYQTELAGGGVVEIISLNGGKTKIWDMGEHQ